MKKRLSMLISLGLVALISIAVIVMVLIQVNYKPVINQPYVVVVSNTNGDSITKTNYTPADATVYNEVASQFEKSFTRSLLSAFFAGQVNGTTVITQIADEDFDNLTFNEYKVEFNYSTAQTLQENGQDLLKSYNKIIFSVNDNAIYKQIKLYFEQVNSDNYYVVTTYALQNSFYDYLQDLFED